MEASEGGFKEMESLDRERSSIIHHAVGGEGRGEGLPGRARGGFN